MNIITYSEKELRTFKEKAFCELDSLILSQLSYLYFDDIVPGFKAFSKAVALKDIYCAEYFDKILDMVHFPENNRHLLAALAASPRFRNIKLNYYVNDLDADREKQFSAITFILDRKTAYIAFRGTDATIIGWKEDFNMAFLEEVPAQTSAKEYINKVSKQLKREYILGGHSKGGNLAVFAGAMCDENVAKKITSIYSHDGPGFKTLTETSEYRNIKDKIHKTVPKAAFVGMMMESQEDYKIVKSNNTGIMQHDSFSWEMDEDGFITEEKISKSAQLMNKRLKKSLSSMSDEDRKKLVNALFQILQSANVSTVYDFEKIKLMDIKSLSALTSGLDSEAKKVLFSTIKKLIIESIKK